jgi:hypothetical protein
VLLRFIDKYDRWQQLFNSPLMATITTKKDIAVKRLEEKLSSGNDFQRKFLNDVNQNEYSDLVDDFETWRNSTASTLRQLFSDNHLAEDFLEDDGVVVPVDKPHNEKVAELKKDVKNSIVKIEHLIFDVKNDLYYQGVDKEFKVAKLGLWQSITIAIITAVAGIITGYITSPNKTDPVERQLGSLTLEGRWKYICTSFDGTYQHGGRFQVQKEKDGTLYLVGERMWRDSYDTLTKTWKNKDFNESDYLQWHTNWIYVKNNAKMNFEYEIPMQKGNILGYCTGDITSQNGKVEYVKGNFYVLNAEEILKGQIIFKTVNDEEYNNKQSLPKNH